MKLFCDLGVGMVITDENYFLIKNGRTRKGAEDNGSKHLFLKNLDHFNKTLLYPSLSCCYLGDEKWDINEETIESCG